MYKFRSGQDPNKNIFEMGTRYKLPCPDALHKFRSGQDPNRNILLSGQDPNKNTYDIGTR